MSIEWFVGEAELEMRLRQEILDRGVGVWGFLKPSWCFVLLLVLFSASAGAAVLGPSALRARHATLTEELSRNAFGGPIVLESQEGARRIEGDVFAVLSYPFPTVSAAITDPGQWCDILILHLNTKHCRRVGEEPRTRIELRVGKKHEQPIRAASLLAFEWRPAVARPDYFIAEMKAGDGPFDTRDYALMVEAIPLDGERTFVHMGYAFSYGMASHFAMHLYLASVGRDKVGFTKVAGGTEGSESLVGGMRGVAERNTLRYYLAIDAYLASLAAAPQERVEQRLRAWFDATERWPRQLHEVERDEYLRMKRVEVRRQWAEP